MNQNELQDFANVMYDECFGLMRTKGASYSGVVNTNDDGDRLSNFKRVAKAVGVSPAQTWLTYFLKHVDSISTYVRTGHESEGPRSRLVDIVNYAILGAALFEEEQQALALQMARGEGSAKP